MGGIFVYICVHFLPFDSFSIARSFFFCQWSLIAGDILFLVICFAKNLTAGGQTKTAFVLLCMLVLRETKGFPMQSERCALRRIRKGEDTLYEFQYSDGREYFRGGKWTSKLYFMFQWCTNVAKPWGKGGAWVALRVWGRHVHIRPAKVKV